jgi:hypothetical protein
MNKCYTVTFGDVAENHVGMQKIGQIANNGYSIEQITNLYERLSELGLVCSLINLNEALPVGHSPAGHSPAESAVILVVKRGVQYIMQNDDISGVMEEHSNLPMDKKVLMRGKVVNKIARWNLCFSEEDQEPNYEEGKGRIISYQHIPLTNIIREQIAAWTEDTLLNGEGNYYYNINKCGIGYHGDSERRKVFAFRMGATMPLHFQWYINYTPIGENIKIELDDGDMYIMSEKAVGFDWKKKKIPTLRHAAGCDKYTTLFTALFTGL